MSEKEVRRLARKKFLRLRNLNSGVAIYLPNGIDRILVTNWEEACKIVKVI